MVSGTKAYEFAKLQRSYLNQCVRIVKKLVSQLKDCKNLSGSILDKISEITKRVMAHLDIKAAGVNL